MIIVLVWERAITATMKFIGLDTASSEASSNRHGEFRLCVDPHKYRITNISVKCSEHRSATVSSKPEVCVMMLRSVTGLPNFPGTLKSR